jgi:hypothetical protein
VTGRLLSLAAVVALCAVTFSAAAGAEGNVYSGYFKTPSGSIYCDYLYGSHIIAQYRYVRCGFKGTLSPQEAKPKHGCPKGTDYVGNRMQVTATGRGQTQPCAGDAGPFGKPKAAFTVGYATTWHGGPFSCTSSKHGMKCKSTDGHGFYLAKHGWNVF